MNLQRNSGNSLLNNRGRMVALVLIAIGCCPGIGFGRQARVDSSLSVRAFGKIRSLEGPWMGTSTKGWKERLVYSTIAAGSVVTEHSFDAHPNEQMFTMFHMDGSRLMLTHYCAAKNQPRLVATEISPDCNTIVFTFLDATNLPSRDHGHMDKLVMRFVNDSTVTSQWTWYQNGKENWLEEIVCSRLDTLQNGGGR